jgi:hypothetical protein
VAEYTWKNTDPLLQVSQQFLYKNAEKILAKLNDDDSINYDVYYGAVMMFDLLTRSASIDDFEHFLHEHFEELIMPKGVYE